MCTVFGHDDMLCSKRLPEKPKKQHTNHDGFQHTSSSHGTNVGSKVQFKESEVSRKVSSSNIPFDALDTIEEGIELGSNGGSSNSGKKVVQDMIEGKLVLLDDDGKPLKPFESILPIFNVVSKNVDDLVNEDNDS
nr:hypothetical protein [Tanacetum cinerariifolium]